MICDTEHATRRAIASQLLPDARLLNVRLAVEPNAIYCYASVRDTDDFAYRKHGTILSIKSLNVDTVRNKMVQHAAKIHGWKPQ